jgi:drug/metabolite transporter (DMT)-like permease
VLRSIRRWAQAASALGAVCLFFLMVPLWAELSPPVSIVVGGMAAVGAVACLVVYVVLRSRLVRRVFAEAAIFAERDRHQRMIIEYQRYRRAVS